MEIQEIIQELEESKKTLDQLTIQLANSSKERNAKELEYNKKIRVEIERARQEGIQATLIKDVVKSRLADLIFEINMATSKETFFIHICLLKVHNYMGNFQFLLLVLMNLPKL